MNWHKSTSLYVGMVFLFGINIMLLAGIFLIEINNSRMLTEKINNQHKKIQDLEKKISIYDQKLSQKTDQIDAQLHLLKAASDSTLLRKTQIISVRDILTKELKFLPTRLTVLERTKLATAVIDYSEEFDLHPALLLGLIRQESGFNPKAKSYKGAQGLTQIMPFTAEDIKVWLNVKYYNPWDIKHNARFGAFYLSKLYHIFEQDLETAIMAYNAGPTRVMKYYNWRKCIAESLDTVECGKEVWLPSETLDFRGKVLGYMKFYESKGL